MSAKRARTGRRGKRAGEPRARAREAFEIEVRECAREIALMRAMLLADFSLTALAAALVMNAVRALAQCVREGTMSLTEARALIERMMDLKLPRKARAQREHRSHRSR